MNIDHVNITRSATVPPMYDVLWEDITTLIKGATPRPVLVVVNDCQPESSEDLQLKKMLDACKLPADKYNIIRLNNEQMVAWHQLREHLDPKIIFLIGVMPVRLGISALFSINVPNNFNDKVWLPTLSIDELGKNAEAKSHLWNNGMKPLFVDKIKGEI